MKVFWRQTTPASWLQRLGSALNVFRATAKRLTPRETKSTRREEGSASLSQTQALKIAGYSLVLMDPDGQVIWTREWDSGGVFEFGPRQRLWVFCGFTNHSKRETEISEYEIELMGEDGLVVERFGDSFGDSVIIPPGESKNFPAEWRM
ncbi:MAG TPA: hypothetical protein VNO24_12365 [Blastocatellia bacterium]|nr:hypothetical protein [Blastocatellia bacterium]